jgi:hypothetical protein
MKKLLLLLLLPFNVLAQPKCWPDATLPTSLYIIRDKTTIKPPIEYGEIIYAASPIGIVWGYTCKAPDGTYWKQIAAGAWENMPRDWLYIADTLLRGTDADRAAAWAKYATASEWDPRLKTDLDAVWALLPNAPPPPVVSAYIVMADPFRADKKRLVYTVVGGKRGPSVTPVLYIAAGEPCDPKVTITEGTITFMSVLGNPGYVARCIKK